VLWPAFSGANQLIASIVMLTAAIWVKKKLNEKYTNLVLIPAFILWVTVTAGIIWYEFVIIPTHFVRAPNMTDIAFLKNQITGVVVGLINVFMLILNVIMIVSFFKNFGTKTAKAEARA
nr:carbon starvation protein A [Spirochaetales bacterium]